MKKTARKSIQKFVHDKSQCHQRLVFCIGCPFNTIIHDPLNSGRVEKILIKRILKIKVDVFLGFATFYYCNSQKPGKCLFSSRVISCSNRSLA